MPYSRFRSEVHGFQFPNMFVNHVLFGSLTTYGRCGGMAYLALDYYFAGLPIPSANTSDLVFTGGVPPDGSWLADSIMSRLYTSFFENAGKWISAYPALSSILNPVGVAIGALCDTFGYARDNLVSITKTEIANLRHWIDRGVPVPLGLVYSAKASELGQSHQVVAYGYEIDDTGMIRIAIYDNNYPGQAVYLTTNADKPDAIKYDGGDFRAFFVSDGYRARLPVVARDSSLPYVDMTAAVEVIPTGTLDAHSADQPITVNVNVKNETGLPAHHNGMALMFWGPQGVFRDDIDGPRRLLPGQQQSYSRKYSQFGVTPGDCWIAAEYVLGPAGADQKNMPLMQFASTNGRQPNLTRVHVVGAAIQTSTPSVHPGPVTYPVRQVGFSFRSPSDIEERLQAHLEKHHSHDSGDPLTGTRGTDLV